MNTLFIRLLRSSNLLDLMSNMLMKKQKCCWNRSRKPQKLQKKRTEKTKVRDAAREAALREREDLLIQKQQEMEAAFKQQADLLAQLMNK